MSTLLQLSTNQKSFFDENGYLLLSGLYSLGELDEAREEMNRLLRDPESAPARVKFSFEPPDETGRYAVDPNNPRRVWMMFDTPLAGDWWFRQCTDTRIVNAIADCLGPNIDFHNGKARIKPPGYRTHQVWHQDWPYERHSRQELAAALLYLDDTFDGAASTYVVPGSHRRGEWPHDEQNAIDAALVGDGGVPICARAGDVAIIHVMTVHRAGHNDTDQNRSCIINEYKTHEAVDEWGNSCAFAEMPLRRGGEPFR